jgi:hypothetical protein
MGKGKVQTVESRKRLFKIKTTGDEQVRRLRQWASLKRLVAAAGWLPHAMPVTPTHDEDKDAQRSSARVCALTCTDDNR